MPTFPSSRAVATAAAALSVAGAAAWAAQTGAKLIVNGQVASSRVRMVGGQAYVPVADVARALGMQLTAKGGNYILSKAGGANQIANENTGKLGDEVFTGKWRFSVQSVERASQYRQHLVSRSPKEIEARPGDELVVVTCRVKNGTRAKDELVFENWEGSNTALTDNDAHSYAPALWDVREDETAPVGAHFLPGAAIDFVLVFDVPKGMAVNDLVFTAIRYDDRASFDQKKRPPTDIRYNLAR